MAKDGVANDYEVANVWETCAQEIDDQATYGQAICGQVIDELETASQEIYEPEIVEQKFA